MSVLPVFVVNNKIDEYKIDNKNHNGRTDIPVCPKYIKISNIIKFIENYYNNFYI